MPKCPSALSAWVPKCPKCSSARVTKCLSSLSGLSVQVPECPSALRLLWMFECPLSVFKCAMHAQMSDHIWLEQKTKYKKMFYVYEQSQKWLRRFWGAWFWSMFWFENPLRSLENLLKIFRGFIYLIFVKIELCFLYGHLCNEL